MLVQFLDARTNTRTFEFSGYNTFLTIELLSVVLYDKNSVYYNFSLIN